MVLSMWWRYQIRLCGWIFLVCWINYMDELNDFKESCHKVIEENAYT